MFRDEACLPPIVAHPAEANRAKTLRIHQMWNFPYAASVEQPTQLGPHETMRSYIIITGIALGLLAVWAAIVPFVA
jgi:hypothetical protein